MKASWDDELDTFCDALWLEEGLSPRTLESYRRDLDQFARWLHARKLDLRTAGAGEVQRFLGERGLKQGIARAASPPALGPQALLPLV